MPDLALSLSDLQGGSITNPPRPPSRFWTEDQVVQFGENQYRIVSRLGSGGVGTTFKVVKIDRAGKERLGTYVAKVARNKETGQQVLAAYELAHSHLRHSALSTIFEVAPAWQDNTFIALMTWIEGEPLSDYPGLLPILAENYQEESSETLAIRWIRTACEALEVLHRNGLVHGDVSPRNMIVSGPELVLTDYDCVGKIGERVVGPGTVLYCSAAYGEGRKASASDDFYALAASFFHVLFDKAPFQYDGTHAKERGLNWDRIERDEHPTLAAFLDRATDPDPQKRFAKAKDALAFLSPLSSEKIEGADTARPSPNETSPTEKFRAGSANMDDLLDALRNFDALRDGEAGGDVISLHSRSAIQPAYADASAFSRISPEISAALRSRGIDRLFQHQADAIQKACDGANVALQAPTASGKTLAFQVPMLQSLIWEPDTHALMLYPNKALALDQRDQLLNITNEIPGPPIDSWWYDGDTRQNHRTVLRQNPPRILITNPDMLHNSFLGHADKWIRLYKNLRWVIVDEIHEYRGYFGSNVAMILRRFSHHLAKQDVHPQFFLSSATCANAREHAENLTGLRFEVVNASNSMRPSRRLSENSKTHDPVKPISL